MFRRAYLASVEADPLTVLDVGSAIVDGQSLSNRDVMTNPYWALLGMDIEPGRNVDIVVVDPYRWSEIATGSIDVVTCSEVFEHAEFFWLTIMEIKRVLKPLGLAFITSPGGGPRHRFPVDCWRFYDDAFPALARYSGLTLLEAQVQWVPAYRKGVQWRDSSAVMQKPAAAAGGPDEQVASIIPEQRGLAAFAAREAELLAATNHFSRKARLVLRQLREIKRIVTTPLHDLHL